MNPARYAAGWAEVRVSGAEPERLLRALAERGVPFWDPAPPKDFSLTLRLPARYEKTLPALAASVGCEAEVIARHGLPVLWRRARRRLSLGLSLLAVLALLCAGLSRIWSIDVTGSVTIPEGVLRQALSECGVDIGARWVGMRQDAVRNGVILRVPGIRWMTVSMQGCRAHVIVRETREAVEPVDLEEYAKVTADKAGFVTRVVAKWGTAAVEPNHAVLPGETIIEGYAAGRYGVQGPCRAIGYAEARTWYERTAATPLETQIKTYTGETHTRFALIFGKNRVNFYKDSSICPEGCDKIIEEYTLGVEGGFVLPVTVEKTTLARYELRGEPAQELRAELEAQLMEQLRDAIGADGEVLSAAFSASEAEGMLYVTLRAECAERIGVTVPLTDEELRQIREKIPKTEETE